MCSVEITRNYDLLNIMRRINENNRDFIPIRPDSVRRVLFGTPLDHEDTARQLNRHLQEMEMEARSRWNFDFYSESPLQGRYQWQRMSNRSRDAERDTRPESDQSRACATTTNTTNAAVADAIRSSETGSVRAPSQGQSAKTEDCSVNQIKEVVKIISTPRKTAVQTKMTDFATQRKRPSSVALKSSTSSAFQSVPSPKLRKIFDGPVVVSTAVAASSSSSTSAVSGGGATPSSAAKFPPT